MKFKIKLIILAALICVPALCPALYAEQRGSLSAYTINYNSNTGEVEASGNVVLTRGKSTVRGESGGGTISSGVFEIRGGVTGVFPEYDADLKTADSLKWTEGRARTSSGTIEVIGKVHITRGINGFLRANYVRWELDTENYWVRGNVNIRDEGRILRAAEAKRTGDTFYGVKVTRYEDSAQRIGMAADRIDGKIKGGEVQESVAEGNVVMDQIDEEGLKTVVTGDRAVYTKELNTVVVSGNAKAVRSDGNTVNAEKLILHVDTNKIEAVGSARVSFTADDKNKSKKDGASD